MLKLKELILQSEKEQTQGRKVPQLKQIAEDYKQAFGIESSGVYVKSKMNVKVGTIIADAYQNLQHTPNDRLVKAAYEQMAQEVVDQFVFFQEQEEVNFEPFEGEGEPYANSYEMLQDIHNYHLYFFKTASGFGEEEIHEDNIMLRKTGIMLGDYELLVNDIFRIVHDIFGHAMYGYGFGPIGEDAAWMAHVEMFSPLAAAALTTETRGQNCWVNFGPHLRLCENGVCRKGESGWVHPAERPFAEQKMNLLPSHLTGIEVYCEKGKIHAHRIIDWHPYKSILVAE